MNAPFLWRYVSAKPTAISITANATKRGTSPINVAAVPVNCGDAPDVRELTPDVIVGNSATATTIATTRPMIPATKPLPTCAIFGCN